MLSKESKFHSGKSLIVIDWGRGGHSSMYLEKIVTAVVSECERVLVFSQYEEELRAFVHTKLSNQENIQFGTVSRATGTSKWLPNRLSSRVAAWKYGLKIRKEICKRLGGLRDVTIFFPCLTDWESIYYHWFCAGLGLPWSALIITFKGMRLEGADMSILRNFNERQCRGVLTLDENRTEWLAERMPGKTVGFLADVSETDWDPKSSLASDIRELAGKRKVVLLIGRLRPVKGVVNFARVALKSGGDDLFFVLAGQLEREDFMEEEQILLFDDFAKSEHCFLHPESLASESEYNAVFRLSSVVSIAYRNFGSSSNSLTKAAFFKIPVIVGQGYLLEERIREYDLGEVVDEHDPDSILAAVRNLTKEDFWETKPECERFREKFSNEAFTQHLRSFIISIFSAGR